ncbi:uncharacterized protein IL334_005505 [Kwoniella shivajii]|uniref:Uncharacterized protein n=1 Tax=Kwoniella shivajii TaxID=564305 RepID=A0ABZ1D3C7_9TREE|nr:hypothetical protein IL334_005505 [Kwoniella shivajii]
MSSKSITSPSFTFLLSRLTKLTSTYSGLDASLMLVQYSSPLVIAVLLALSRLIKRARLSGLAGYGQKGAAVASGWGLLQLAEGWGKMGVSVGDARVVFRAFGLLPILQYLLTLHPNPIASLKKFIFSIGQKGSLSSEKTLPTLQLLSLAAYYPLEHIAWLASKGILPISAQRTGKAALWSVRFWALYVLLDIYKSRQTYISLLKRTKQLKYQKPIIQKQEAEGFELPPSPSSPSTEKPTASLTTPTTSTTIKSEEDNVSTKAQLQNDWKVWKNQAMINSGYAPLTVHWSTPGGLWTNPLISGTFGCVAAVGRLTAEWRKGN